MTDRIALQLYTLRAEAARDLLGTLAAAARIGYRAVELAGYHGVPVSQVRAVLDDLGIRAVAAHVPWEDFEDRPREALDELLTLGCAYAVVPSLPRALQRPDAVPDVAERIRTWSALCAARDVRLGYHNHAFELELTGPGGETLLDLLVAGTEPADLLLELDVYWARVAGADPIALIERHAGRVALIHLKDMRRDGRDAPVGEGILPWPEIAGAARRARVDWYVVEQDEPDDPLADVATSLRNARALLGD